MSIDSETLSWLQSNPSGYIEAAEAVRIAWDYVQSSRRKGDLPLSPIPTTISLDAGAPPEWMISFTYEGPHAFTVLPNGVCVRVDALAGTSEFLQLK